ncbi:MAG: hypothetical protein ACRDYA_05085 [Egibacteraceae bacterium]
MTEQDQRLSTDDLAGTHPSPPETSEPVEPIEMGPGPTATHTVSDQTPLLAAEKTEEYRWRWDAIQAHFVDSPRDAVADADELVAELMRHLAEVFSRERGDLEASWERGEDISTEDLRVSLQRYRSFFNRLLAT